MSNFAWSFGRVFDRKIASIELDVSLYLLAFLALSCVGYSFKKCVHSVGLVYFASLWFCFLEKVKCYWQVLLVRDFLRGLCLSRSRTEDGQKEMGRVCVLVHGLAVTRLQWLRIYISLNFWVRLLGM